MGAKHRCNRDDSQKGPYPVNSPAGERRSFAPGAASASLIVLAALGAPGAARAACVPVPQIPLNRITQQVDYNVTEKWIVSGSANWQSSFSRYGDEANLTPPLPGYFLASLCTVHISHGRAMS